MVNYYFLSVYVLFAKYTSTSRPGAHTASHKPQSTIQFYVLSCLESWEFSRQLSSIRGEVRETNVNRYQGAETKRKTKE